MDEQQRKAFDFAQEATKQVLTLSAGIFALTITFLKDVVKDNPAAKGDIEWLHRGWLFYVISVFFGVVTLLMLSGNLERPNKGSTPSIYAPNIIGAAVFQMLAFVVALICTLVFGSRVT